MSRLFGSCGRGVDGTFWCFYPPAAPIHESALDGVLDYSAGGALFSGFLNSEPSSFDCEVMSNHSVACEGSDDNAQLGFAISSVQTCQYDCTPILQQQQVFCPFPCEKKPRAVPGVGSSTAVISNGGPCALQTDGTVACWGSDANGNVVAAHTIALPDKAVSIGGGSDNQSSCAVLANGQLACWMVGKNGPIDTSGCPSTGCPVPALVPGLTNLVAISTTWDHGCVLRNDGAVFCWGGSPAGLGDGTGNTSVTPVRVVTSLVFSHIATDLAVTCGLTRDGHIACWGAADAPPGVNGATACPTSNPVGCRLVPVEIPGVANVKQVSAIFGGPFAYALLDNGTVLSIDDTWNGGFAVKQVAP